MSGSDNLSGVQFPWAHQTGELHDGVEEHTGLTVAHPDDTPYHDETAMRSASSRRGIFDLEAGHGAMQAWLERGTLDHVAANPHLLDEPVMVLKHHDEQWLLNGHHRAAVARATGRRQLPAIIREVR